MMRYAAALGAIPLLLFGAVAVSRPSPPAPVKPVLTEGVRMIRMDSQTFRARWRPVHDMAPALVVHEVPVTEATAVTIPPPAQRIVKRASLRGDICARHGRRKVEYLVRGYKHWRCQR